MEDNDKAFYSGICVALQHVSVYDHGVCWHDIVNSVGFDRLKKYVIKIEPAEFELIEFKKYAKSEFGKTVRRPREFPK